MRGIDSARRAGFTLVEVIVTVVIIAILAAVAIPALRSYIIRSKASEAGTLLQGIREKEEAYFAEFKRYTTDLPARPDGLTCDSCAKNTTLWALAADDPWRQLGFTPDGPTYYSYRVTTSDPDGDGSLNGYPAAADAPGTTWEATLVPWFTAEACGDLDCDGNPGHFFVSSQNKVVHQKASDQY